MIDHIKHQAHTLGALFYYGPLAAETKGILESIHTQEIVCLLPQINLEEWQSALLPQHAESLKEAWQAMFIGPHRLAAPPWGSVYLDPDNVVFGCSLLELRDFLETYAVIFQNDANEPEDHVGLLFLLLVTILERADSLALARILLNEHMLPWIPYYLTRVLKQGRHPFIDCLAKTTQVVLDEWTQLLDLHATPKKIYI